MTLAAIELQELERCELVIERGLKTFVEVGEALRAIRDKRLYRQAHDTFEDYCRDKWGIVASRARQLIGAANVIANVESVTNVTPANEAQARPLARLEPEQQREVWQEVVQTAPNGRVTAAHVEQVAARHREGEVNGRDLSVHYSSSTDEWETPQDLFNLLNEEFGFTLDVCALPENAKCEHYFTPDMDGLSQKWEGVCWMNPPYGNEIRQWIGQAYAAAQFGATVVCLVPARVDTAWWWDFCRHGEVRFMRGRLRFGNAENSAPFPSAVVIFGRGYPAKVVWWDNGNV